MFIMNELKENVLDKYNEAYFKSNPELFFSNEVCIRLVLMDAAYVKVSQSVIDNLNQIKHSYTPVVENAADNVVQGEDKNIEKTDDKSAETIPKKSN